MIVAYPSLVAVEASNKRYFKRRMYQMSGQTGCGCEEEGGVQDDTKFQVVNITYMVETFTKKRKTQPGEIYFNISFISLEICLLLHLLDDYRVPTMCQVSASCSFFCNG